VPLGPVAAAGEADDVRPLAVMPPAPGKRTSHLIVGTVVIRQSCVCCRCPASPSCTRTGWRGWRCVAWQPIPVARPLLCVTVHLSPRTSWPGRCRACRSWSQAPSCLRYGGEIASREVAPRHPPILREQYVTERRLKQLRIAGVGGGGREETTAPGSRVWAPLAARREALEGRGGGGRPGRAVGRGSSEPAPRPEALCPCLPRLAPTAHSSARPNRPERPNTTSNCISTPLTPRRGSSKGKSKRSSTRKSGASGGALPRQREHRACPLGWRRGSSRLNSATHAATRRARRPAGPRAPRTPRAGAAAARPAKPRRCGLGCELGGGGGYDFAVPKARAPAVRPPWSNT